MRVRRFHDRACALHDSFSLASSRAVDRQHRVPLPLCRRSIAVGCSFSSVSAVFLACVVSHRKRMHESVLGKSPPSSELLEPPRLRACEYITIKPRFKRGAGLLCCNHRFVVTVVDMYYQQYSRKSRSLCCVLRSH